jgi:hypothetical protein
LGVALLDHLIANPDIAPIILDASVSGFYNVDQTTEAIVA